MRYFCTLAFTIFALTTALVNADEGFYAGLDAGPNWVNHRHNDFDIGFVAAGQVGYKFCNGFRLEGEAAYRHNYLRRIENGDLKFHAHARLRTWSYMAHLIYDFDFLNCRYFTPYVGAGLGYTNQKFHVDKLDNLTIKERHEKNGFAWDVLAGIAFPLNDCLILDVHYHYLQGKNRINNNGFEGGFRYYF